ncbi:MAG: hypothetical protein ABJB05_09130 [Parafilimonas sp.]
MTFQIEQVLVIRNKAYLLTKSLNNNISFRLSDNSLLGDFEIEKWFDIPKSTDSNGNFRTDKFVFVLKNNSDKEKVSQGDILKLSDLYVTVVESNYTVSGKIISALECGTGMLSINTLLTNQEKKWNVIKNNLIIGRPKDIELQKRITDNFYFFYNLEPIDHTERPEVGTRLRVTLNGS